MCLHPIQITRINPLTHSSRIDVVPCGKCVECLKRKQNDYAFVAFREALRSGSVYFLTLTYRNDTIPFAGAFELVDENDTVLDRSRVMPVREEYLYSVRQEYFELFDSSENLIELPHSYASYEVETYEKEWLFTEGRYTTFQCDSAELCAFGSRRSGDRTGLRVRFVSAPSLNRRDVKGSFKVLRTRWKRTTGKDLNLRFLEIGEYGPKTKRPHYHLMLYGITRQEVDFVVSYFTEHFGRVDVEQVVARRGDSYQRALQKVSRYLAKYMSKGVFEFDLVKFGIVERPRRVSSRNIGCLDLRDLYEYVHAFDVFGKYDPNRPPAKVVRNINVLVERQYITDPCHPDRRLRIPKVILQKLYSKTYELDSESRKLLGFVPKDSSSFAFRVSHNRNTTSRLISSFKKSLFEDRVQQIVVAAKTNSPLGSSLLSFRRSFTELVNSAQTSRLQAAETSRMQLQTFYNKSLM